MDFATPIENEVVGYIDKSIILSNYKEEDIFELVFGFKPVEYQYVTSPFRVDNNPGCWFERNPLNNKLIFVDYGDSLFNKQDCFSCIKRYFKLPNFYRTLLFINESLSDKIKHSNDFEVSNKTELTVKEKKKVEIYIKPRNFLSKR